MGIDRVTREPTPMFAHLGPVFRNFYTDIGGIYFDHQGYGYCSVVELNMMHCLEAYGYGLGYTKCVNYIEDYMECFSQRKQQLRVYEMHKERTKKYFNNELKQRYEESPKWSFHHFWY